MRANLTLAMAAIAVASSAQAAQVLDQSNLVAPTPRFQIVANDFVTTPPGGQPTSIDAANLQFVTAGLSGQLTQVDLQLAQLNGTPGGGKLVIARNVTFDDVGVIATATVLGSLSFGKSAIAGQFTSFDTKSLGINLTAGDQFVIAVLPEQVGSFIFGWAFGDDVYSGGKGYVGVSLAKPDDDNFNWFAADRGIVRVSPRDYGFRTFMTPGSVPETSTWAMMIVGFGMAGAAVRKRRINVAFG